MKTFVGFMIALALSAGVLLAQGDSVAGTWNVTMVGDGQPGHGFPPVEMEIEQDGSKVTGNFMIPDHGDLPLEGEFVGGSLRVHSTADAFMKVSLAATLDDKGGLSGKMDSLMGAFSWTASRKK